MYNALALGMLTGCAAAQTETSQGTDLRTDREQAMEEQDALPQEPADAQIGDTHTVSLVCDMAGTGEGLWYLTLEVMKQEEGWKILSYGMEK